MKKTLLIFLISCSILVFAACADQPPAEGDAADPADMQEEKTPITIVLDWVPNINHSGLYIALAEGYFSEQGLEVEIIQPGDNMALQLVAAGQAEFGISYQEEVTFARAAAIPVQSIAAIIQHNTSCFAAPSSKDINSIADFAGKKYGGWGGEVEEALLNYLAESENFSQEIEIINIGSADFFAATEASVDFSWIYYGVTGIEAELRGIDISTIFLKDIDTAFDYYTPVIVAEEAWLAEHGDLARSFLTAAAKGYAFADNYPEQAADILLQAAPELSPDMIKEGQKWLAGKYQDDAAYWGEQQAKTWQDFADWLYQRELLEQPFDAEAAFTNQYLPQ